MNAETLDRSHELYHRACQYIPGGVNSPVRAFQSVDYPPVFIKYGKGAYVVDVDDRHYIDYVGSWGPLILGHAHPKVLSAIERALPLGLSFGMATEIEVDIAARINQFMPSIEMVRMVSSGTETTMSAIRLARGITGRDKIIKFAGCYHGHSDSLLVNAGSGALTFGVPSSAGVPACIAEQTLVADFNDLASVEAFFERYPNQIAAIIVEPVAGNMGCIPPHPQFLQGLRSLCDHYQSLLIFDEVITGFRVAPGGAQTLYQIKPDITTLGKIIGGGMPVGAFGGSREIMEHIAPLGSVYQAGTLSGNPIAMAAGYATLSELLDPTIYQILEIHSQRLVEGLKQRAAQANIDVVINRVGSMFTLFFTSQEAVTNLTQVKACNVERFKQFFRLMLKQGVYLAPSAFESGFLSICHRTEEVDLTLNAAERAFMSL